MRARGGFLVDLAWEKGRLSEATIQASRDGICTVRSSWPIVVVLNEEEIACSNMGQLTSFNVQHGNIYQIIAR
ncbi:glycoside hydrolase family 95-like protein [Paenibacillus aceris]|uniref:glycoside hydrolase family 95-like protein n=1 Tax=Paenibacillus aceris TaxID=869555 RepID=UPI003B8493AC